ncbi:MAG: hypothetical protein GVY24_08050 [Planctomycetes bacterium]|jgi:SNF2 family DNA or RNA helicase|nr:hypothetical protein [Planctomycetota bacterium]
MKLRQSQEELIGGVFEHDEQLCVAGMGAGKTGAVLHALNELHDRDVIDCALVLAPPLVAATVWPNEAPKWPDLRYAVDVRFAQTPAKREKLLLWLAESDSVSLRVGAISFHVCKWLKDKDYLIPRRCALVVDETSFFKDARAKNGKALRSIARRFPVRYGLTGTPRPNGWEDAWGQYQLLADSKLWRPFDEWRRRNFMPKDPHGYTWEVHDFRAKELERDVAPYTTTVDADLDMPPLNAGADHDTVVELPPKARAAYDDMEDKLIAKVVADRRAKHGEPAEEVLVAALSEGVASGKLSQIAQGYLYETDAETGKGAAVSELHDAKIEALREMIASAGGENLLIWYGYRHDIELAKRALGTKTLPVLGGGTSAAQGRRHIEAFSRGEIPYLLAHPASAAHGIDALKHGGRRMIWFCPTWSAEQYEQALKRLDRPGQTRPVFSHRVVAKDTVDELKVGRVEGKLTEQEEWRRVIRKVRKEMEG